LLSDAGIIRDRLKVNAVIENARRIQSLRNEYGSFKGWLDSHHPQTLENWTKLFKRNFIFTGGEIVKEFLMRTGYLPGAHASDCPIYEVVIAKSPACLMTSTANRSETTLDASARVCRAEQYESMVSRTSYNGKKERGENCPDW